MTAPIKVQLDAKDTAPAWSAAAVTPSDGADLPTAPTRALYIGGVGDVKVNMADGVAVTYPAVPVGSILPIACTRVFATGTTATNIVAMY